MMTDLLVLVEAYIRSVNDEIVALKRHLGTDALVDAVRKDRTLRKGNLSRSASYAFHGVGCRVIRGGRTTDFDFGPAGAIGGFDAWRLWTFAVSDPSKFAKWQELKKIEGELQRLLTDGLVELPRKEPSPHLYYLTSAGLQATSLAPMP
jgi:hypothetical protein